jgi:hypothetical protein
MGISKAKFYRRGCHHLGGGLSTRSTLSFARKVHRLTHRAGNVDIESSTPIESANPEINPPGANTRPSIQDIDPPDINLPTCISPDPESSDIGSSAPPSSQTDSMSESDLDTERRQDVTEENLSEILNVCMFNVHVF